MRDRKKRRAAIADPAYHRHLMFSLVDRMMAKATGKPVPPHERADRLPWPQLKIIKRVERAVAEKKGELLTVLMARQTGKNEVEAQLENRFLTTHRGIPGASWVRVAPTKIPQLVNSRIRLEKHYLADPLLRRGVRTREGFIYQNGNAQLFFLSGSANANVVGGTASACLSIDEAHKIDAGKFNEDFGPFTASTNAPTVLWGVAADGQDMLHEFMQRQLDDKRDDLVLRFPADIWCELSPVYAAHYAEKCRLLGPDHYVIQTQYDLKAVDAHGKYLSAAQRESLFSGDHERLQRPRDGMTYLMIADLGGESENDVDDAAERLSSPGRDYTMVWIIEVDPRQRFEVFPRARIVDGAWWVGRKHEKVGPDLVRYARWWRVRSGIIDGRGVGEAVGGYVHRRLPGVVSYKASPDSVSEDCYGLHARLNAGTVQFWRGDTAQDEELREIQQQARQTRYEIKKHDLMRITKPTGAGSTEAHIDGIKALTYIHRALNKVGLGQPLVTFR